MNIDYHVNYGKGSKFVLTISEEGLVEIKAPKDASKEKIEEFVKINSDKITKTLDKLKNREYISAKKEYENESRFLLHGKTVSLSEIIGNSPDLDEEEIQKELLKFYMKETKNIISKRVPYYEKILNVKAKGFNIVNSPSTWGTCNSRKELTFHYKLSMAALPVIDYVVIHELCHIFHMNHDRSFWRKVGSVDKNYEAKQEYLRKLGPYMNI